MTGKRGLNTGLVTTLIAVCLASCTTTLPKTVTTGRHLEAPAVNPAESDIPDVVTALPLVHSPQATASPELYSFVVLDQPVREVLFAIGRDAGVNIDIHPGIRGNVSINVIDQSIPQILNRLSRQVEIRWLFDDSGNLIVEPDEPFWKSYKVDYVNVQRSANGGVQISSTIAQIGDAANAAAQGNQSNSSINLSSTNDFWGTLDQNLQAMLDTNDADATSPIIINAESGMVNVRGTAKQQQEVADYLDVVISRSLNQVLIEATVVEVRLSDSYQSGVDWSMFRNSSSGLNINFQQNNTSPGLSLPVTPTNVLTISSDNNNDLDIANTVSLLEQFGELRVVSSPKMMTMNNQPAQMQSVDNLVYFDVEAQGGIISSNGVASQTTLTTNINTIPVGFFLNIIPQIGENDQVTLNIRPTITRQLGYVVDPNPALAQANIESRIPQIQTTEFESVLKVFDGQIAVLGGLMQDSYEQNTDGLPVVSRIPGLRNFFSYRDDRETKTELVVFIRPVIVRAPSIDGDLNEYRSYLPTTTSVY